jgi:hypothetical protein
LALSSLSGEEENDDQDAEAAENQAQAMAGHALYLAFAGLMPEAIVG